MKKRIYLSPGEEQLLLSNGLRSSRDDIFDFFTTGGVPVSNYRAWKKLDGDRFSKGGAFSRFSLSLPFMASHVLRVEKVHY
jgi:hypothetical protein